MTRRRVLQRLSIRSLFTFFMLKNYATALLRVSDAFRLSPSDIAVAPYKLGQDLERDYVASGAQAQVDAFQGQLVDTVLGNNNALINHTLAGMEERRAAASQVHDARRFCKKDYTVVCPDGWEERSKRGRTTCVAPASYKGPCSTVLQTGLDREAKGQLEQTCLVAWPCFDFCERDYRTLCPVAWEETASKLCRASATYADRCERIKDFTHFTPELKEAWSRSCNVRWPCAKECDEDYTAACPDGWQPVTTPGDTGLTCSAPSSYTGPCGPEEAITHFSSALKRAFADRCSVKFPCVKKESSCSRDYRQLCPQHWVPIVEDTSCQAPESYSGTCGFRLYPANMTTEDKVAQESACGLAWPCKEDCVRSYEEPCPQEWKEQLTSTRDASNPHGSCIPAPAYQGPCRGPKKLWDKTVEMKAAFAEHCAAPWPCKSVLHAPSQQKTLTPSGQAGASIYGHGGFGNFSNFGANGPVDPRTGHVISYVSSQ